MIFRDFSGAHLYLLIIVSMLSREKVKCERTS